MTRTLIILSLPSGSKVYNAEFYYSNGINKCGEDYIDELKPIGCSVESVRNLLLAKGFSLNGAGLDGNAPIGDVLLVWIDSLHILTVENGAISEVETLRKHGN